MRARGPPMAERRLTVSSSLRVSRAGAPWQVPKVAEVPFLRLNGVWLGGAGFPVGRKVRVEVSAERLVITPASPAGEAGADA